jgi:type III secretion protein J
MQQSTPNFPLWRLFRLVGRAGARIRGCRRFLPVREGMKRVCVVCMLGILCACAKMVVLQSNLSDADANEIVMVLTGHGIEVKKEKAKEGVNLLVSELDLSRATQAMTAAGLPRRAMSNLGQEFKKQGMISSPMEERVRYIYGLSEELAYTLQQFDGVITARVHVVLPERVAPGEPIQPSSAAVMVKYRPPMDEDSVVPRIRRMVAASIPGLAEVDGRSKISVVMTPSEAHAPAVQWTTVGPFAVQLESAGSLKVTLVILILLAGAGAAVCVIMLIQNLARLKNMIGSQGEKLAKLKTSNTT